MIEKLLQLLRLALTLLACCGYLRACMRAFRLRAELALPVSLSAIGLVMLLGGVLGVLVPTVWLMFRHDRWLYENHMAPANTCEE